MQPSTIVIALPIEDEQLEPIHHWAKKYDWSHVESVHFVHVVKRVITTMEFGYIEAPDEKGFQEMKPTLEKFLRDESLKILPAGFQGETHFHLTISFNAEDTISEYIEQVGADVLIVGTRGKHGLDALLHHSFAHHMVKHAPCDVFVVRPDQPTP